MRCRTPGDKARSEPKIISIILATYRTNGRRWPGVESDTSTSCDTPLDSVQVKAMAQIELGLGDEKLARAEWIAACHFHDLTEAQVLAKVSERVQSTPKPVVLLDLDSTLYEVGPRTFQILKEWILSTRDRDLMDHLHLFKEFDATHVGYSVKDTFEALGISPDYPQYDALVKSAKEFWGDRFFTSAYLRYDHPYPGAPEFAQKIYDSGATLVYLTGRDEKNMGPGTIANLIRDHFPWGKDKRTHLLLKPLVTMNDLEHKVRAGAFVKAKGNLVASFENEPPNVVALSQVFPESMHVFVDTIYSDHLAPVCRGLYRIKGF